MKILFALLLFLTSFSIQAQKTLSLNPSQTKYLLGKHLEILADSSGNLTFQEVSSDNYQKKFIPSRSPSPNFGLTKTVYWARVTLKNPSNEAIQRLIENGYAITHYLDLFVLDKKGKLIFSAKGGSQYPFHQRLVDYRKIIFPTKIPPLQSYTYYFRFQSQTSMQLLLTVWNPVAFAEKTNKELYFWGGYLGIILSIILYNLFVAVSLRSASYTYYIIYIGCFGIIQLSIEGLAYQYLWPNATWWTNNNIPFLILLSGFSSIAFTQGFLITKQSKKWLHKTLNIIRYASFSFVLVLFLPYNIGIKISAPLALITLLSLLLTGAIRLREGYRPARFFMMAWFTFILGVALLILKNFGIIPTTFITNNTASIGSALEAILLSVALADRLKVLTQERDEATQKNLTMQKQINVELEKKVKERTYEIEEKNAELLVQNEEIIAQRDLLGQQKEAIEEQHIQITSSINYAQRIQQAMLPDIQHIKENFDDCFVLFKPRDIVSGDFYWFTQLNDNGLATKLVLAVIDCTGHGVPGGFMSMVGNELLNDIIHQRKIYAPDQVLQEIDAGIRRVLKQKETGNRDGMDMALVMIDLINKNLHFSGAKCPLVYVQEDKLHCIKGDKLPIGGEQLDAQRNYTCHQIAITQPTTFYLYSDGYQDQFGGDQGRKFMSKRFRELLFSIHSLPMEQQRSILNQTLEDWRQGSYQVDDILVTGVKLGEYKMPI